jgi:uncharacterized alkaline shock family protein YloU
MSLGAIHYSQDVFISIIKTEVLNNHPVSSVSIKMDEVDEVYVFSVDVFFTEKESLVTKAKDMQKRILSVLKTMTGLTNVKINIGIKGLKLDK